MCIYIYIYISNIYIYICCFSVTQLYLFVTPWIVACQASLSFSISQSLLKLMSIGVHDAIQPSHPLLPPSPALNLSQHKGLFK